MTKRNESFDTDAKQYDEGRLSYPDEVIDWIIEKTGISNDKTLLEIGAGTGQATLPFARRGFSVHCVELGQNLADLLVQKTSDYNVTVDVAPFEQWQQPERFCCPLIFCATAFHWLDIHVKYQKCHSLLSDGGYLVLLWNDAPNSNNPIIDQAYRRLFSYNPKKKKSRRKHDATKDTKKEIRKSGLFEVADFLHYEWELLRSKEKFVAEFYSQSSFLSLSQEQQQALSQELNELFAALDDELHAKTYTAVYVCRKIGGRKKERCA